MSKNRNQCFLGSDTLHYKDIKLKSIIAMPPNLTAMVVDTDSEDEVVMRDCVETSHAYCLAMGEDHHGDIGVYPYNIENGFDVRASIVQVRHCPKCGKRMHMTMDQYDVASLKYNCRDCGYEEPSWTEVEAKKHE
jgi:predicted RNA-binding Zn-ribbon protein involved in translation (DUF1610 family)